MKKLLLFDVDLTLISTGGAGIRALNRAFRELRTMENVMDGIQNHGKTDLGIIREIFASRQDHDPPPDLPEAMAEILEAYLGNLAEEIQQADAYRILPGILSILDELSGRSDVLLGLATGNVERGARIKLQRGDLNRYFKFGGFGSDSENRTDLVRRAAELALLHGHTVASPGDVFVIGDTPLDVRAGREAGFSTVGVATGKYSQSELAESGATFVIADFEQGRDQFLRTTFIA